MSKFFITICISIMLFMGVNINILCAQTSDMKNLETAWLPEYETFPLWYIQKQNLDRKSGYNFVRNMYPTGKRLVDSLHADKWFIAGTGLVPAVATLIKNNAVIVGIGVDETDGNEILARADNTIFMEKGINSEFPHVFGSAKSIRGKTILCPIDTNSHQLLIAWLEIFGLQQNDVAVIDIKPEDILESFKEGLGDFAVLWKPNTTEAKNLGFQTVASASDCKIKMLTIILANKKILESNKEDIQNFLKIYFDAINEIQAMSNIDQVALYKEFIMDTSSLNITDSQALNTILTHKIYNMDAQIVEFTNKASNFYKTLNDSIDFYATAHMLSRRDIEKLKNAEYIYLTK